MSHREPQDSSRAVPPDRLLFRRQFVLGPHPIDSNTAWRHVWIEPGLCLSVHPDLDYAWHAESGVSLHLLGYLLDPTAPEAGDKQILASVHPGESSAPFADLLERLKTVSGRWAIVYTGPEGTRIVNDMLASREVYYAFAGNHVWCGSQPQVLAERIGVPFTQDPAIIDFIGSPKFAATEHRWVGRVTGYDNIFHLLPNHYLDLTKRRAQRFWPSRPLVHTALGDAVEQCSALLKGLLRAAALRRPLMQAITAGGDSRVLLAVSREMQDEVFWFIQSFGPVGHDHPDVRVPQRLAQRLGIAFNIIDCPDDVPAWFSDTLRKNAGILQSDSKVPLHYNFYRDFPDRLNVSTIGSEIGRTYQRWDVGATSPESLAECFGRPGNTLAIRELSAWLGESWPACRDTGIDIFDLFFWEQLLGNWGTMFPSELDIAIEEYYPFNCRRLMEVMLSVAPEHRKYKSPDLHTGITRANWPETLLEPINPHKSPPKRQLLRKVFPHPWRRRLAGLVSGKP